MTEKLVGVHWDRIRDRYLKIEDPSEVEKAHLCVARSAAAYQARGFVGDEDTFVGSALLICEGAREQFGELWSSAPDVVRTFEAGEAMFPSFNDHIRACFIRKGWI